MALIRQHWKLAIANSILIVFSIIAMSVYFERSGSHVVTAATSGADSGSGSATTPIVLDATGYTRVFQLRNALCLTDVDLAAMGCSQSQAAGIISALGNWYQSNSAAWDSIGQQITTARQQIDQAKQTLTGSGSASLAREMADANAQIDVANSNLLQLMQTAAPVIAAQLTPNQQAIWNSAQSNVANGVPAQFRYTPDLTPAQANALSMVVAQHRTTAISVLTLQQQQAIASILHMEMQNAVALFSSDQAVLPVPSQLMATGSAQQSSLNR